MMKVGNPVVASRMKSRSNRPPAIDTNFTEPSVGVSSSKSSTYSAPFTPDQRIQMMKMLEAGTGSTEIAQILGLKSGVVSCLKQRIFIPGQINPDYDGSHTLTKEEKSRIKLQYKRDENHSTYAQITAHYNCPFSQVGKTLLKKRKAGAASNDGSDNEGGERDGLSSDDEVVVKKSKRAKRLILSDDEL